MPRILALIAALGFALSVGGCAHMAASKLEVRPVVAHYESQSEQLQKKERSGAEGGCPTCVY